MVLCCPLSTKVSTGIRHDKLKKLPHIAHAEEQSTLAKSLAVVRGKSIEFLFISHYTIWKKCEILKMRVNAGGDDCAGEENDVRRDGRGIPGSVGGGKAWTYESI